MKQLTVKNYFELKETLSYDVLLKSLKPKNYFSGVKMDINNFSYIKVRSLFKLSQNPKLAKELFMLAFGVTEQEFFNETITNLFAAQNYLYDLIKKLIKKESDLLKSIGTDANIWQRAGGDKLNVFSDLLPLVQLGEIYSIYPLDLQEKKYNEILVLLTLHKTKSEVMSEYQTLKSK